MNIWFLKLEGVSGANSDINYPFGFYVNCLISSEEGMENVKDSILLDLKEDGFSIKNIKDAGEYKDFYWKEREAQIEFDSLAKESINNPDVIYYSNFHIWKL